MSEGMTKRFMSKSWATFNGGMSELESSLPILESERTPAAMRECVGGESRAGGKSFDGRGVLRFNDFFVRVR